MSGRTNIGKRLRFDVFKRDGFMCQYCGAHPPQAVLEVDHITPVSAGGTNDPDNLITACFSCNRGKAAVSLSVVPQSLADKAAEVAEREEQVHGYNAVLQARRDRLEDEAWQVIKGLLGRTETKRDWFNSAKMFVDKLGLHEVLDAVDATHRANIFNEECHFRYFCGVCWTKIREGAR